jgi:V/A-type H+-transporting ATPase subunit I
MKKYTFLIFHKDYHPFLYALRELGVMHVVEKQSGMIEEHSDLYGFINNGKRFATIIKALNKIKEEHNITDLRPENKKENGIALLEKTEQLYAEREQAAYRRNVIIKELERIEPWGYFDLELIKKLEQTNLFVHLHTTSTTKFKEEWSDEYNAIKIHQQGSTIYFITITKEAAPPEINAEQIRSFDDSATDLENALAAINDEIRQIDESLKMMVKDDLNTLIYKENETGDQIKWEQVALSSEAVAGEKVMLLEGFVPEEQEPETTKALQTKNVYFEVTTPKLDEKPPILLKNNKFARTFEMISNIYDKPSYHAFDMTMLWAPFYIMFFGFCVGDCGYGLLFVLMSFFLRKVKMDFLRSVSNLVLWLGIGTVIFGFLGGTFFGIPLLEQSWQWLEKLKGAMLNSEQTFVLALILGCVHIYYALIIKAISDWIRHGLVKSLDTFGWLLTLAWAATFGLQMFGMLSPETFALCGYILLCPGVALMFLFNNPEKGLKGIPASIGAGLWNLFNRLTGILGDILSYIRLFALGIAGAVLGLVFNQLAFGFAPDIVILKQLVIVIILIFGHAINLFMGSLGGFIHPLRLTFVEFYKNAGFEGGGKEYQPFRKKCK